MEHRNPVLIDRCVACVLELARIVLLRTHELLLTTRSHITMLLVLVHRIVQTTEQTAVYGRPVHDDRVLLIVSTVAGNGDNRIHSERHLLHLQNVHGPCFDDRAADGTEHVGILVQAFGEVGRVDTHGLLTHS